MKALLLVLFEIFSIFDVTMAAGSGDHHHHRQHQPRERHRVVWRWPRRPHIASLDCRRIFERNVEMTEEEEWNVGEPSEYTKRAANHYFRMTISDNTFFRSDTYIPTCEEIRERNADMLLHHYHQQHRRYFPFYGEKKTPPSSNYPLAFSTIVYTDYLQVEWVFAYFAHEKKNRFCYVVDAKAKPEFKARMRNLAECFPEQIELVYDEFSISSNGHNATAAYLACSQRLTRHRWHYLIQLQNHDLPMRTNAELIEVARILNGTNDVGTDWPVVWSSYGMPDNHLHFKFDRLRLFPDDGGNNVNDDAANTQQTKRQPATDFLWLTKSLVQTMLSRSFVTDFLLNTASLHLEGFINLVESDIHGVDEYLLATLNSNDVLRAPGGFTQWCLLKRKTQVSQITRYNVWRFNWEVDKRLCRSQLFRHEICLPGLEDLARLAQQPQLFLNKVMQSGSHANYAALHCWMEAMVYSSRHPHETNAYGFAPLNRHFYATLPHVRWNNNPRSHHADFDCTHHGYKHFYPPAYEMPMAGDRLN